jgi:hypothetical protein
MESCQRLCHFLVEIREQCLPADRSKSGARPFSFAERKDFFRPAIVYDRVRQGCSNCDSTRPLQIVVNAIKSVDGERLRACCRATEIRYLKRSSSGARKCAPASAGKGRFHNGPRSLVEASVLLWKQGGFVDRLRDLLPQEQTSVVIETVVLSGIDAADARLLRPCRETGEVALHSS